MKTKISLTDAIAQLKNETGKVSTIVLTDGSVSVEYFSPNKNDTQTIHTKNELYLITRGHGTLLMGEEKIQCIAGDILTVRAGTEHRFVDFSDDLSAWVIFYTQQG